MSDQGYNLQGLLWLAEREMKQSFMTFPETLLNVASPPVDGWWRQTAGGGDPPPAAI